MGVEQVDCLRLRYLLSCCSESCKFWFHQPPTSCQMCHVAAENGRQVLFLIGKKGKACILPLCWSPYVQFSIKYLMYRHLFGVHRFLK